LRGQTGKLNATALARAWGWNRSKVRGRLASWRAAGHLPKARRRSTGRPTTMATMPPIPLRRPRSQPLIGHLFRHNFLVRRRPAHSPPTSPPPPFVAMPARPPHPVRSVPAAQKGESRVSETGLFAFRPAPVSNGVPRQLVSLNCRFSPKWVRRDTGRPPPLPP
jgi:hypothetical protein